MLSFLSAVCIEEPLSRHKIISPQSVFWEVALNGVPVQARTVSCGVQVRLALQKVDPDVAEALTSHLARRVAEQSRLAGTVQTLEVIPLLICEGSSKICEDL